MLCKYSHRFTFKTKPYHRYRLRQQIVNNVQLNQPFSTNILPLPVIKRKDLDHIDGDELIDIVRNIGFLKLEIAPNIQVLLNEIESELKLFYNDLNYGQKLTDEQRLSHWWPQQSLFFGYSNHYNDKIPNQFEQFHITPQMMNHELNPFKDSKNVMHLFDYLCSESYEIFEKIWLRLELFPVSDFEKMIGGKELNQTIAVNNFDPYTLTMNKNNSEWMRGFSEHNDSGLITILKNAGPGFQVWHNDEWYDIDCEDKNENFVVNFGSLISETTKYSKIPFKACCHRVVPITDYQRLTIAIFNDAKWNGMLYRYDENQQLSECKTYKSHIEDIYAGITGESV